MSRSLAEMATEVLITADGREKTRLSRAHAVTWLAARAEGRPIAAEGTAATSQVPTRAASRLTHSDSREGREFVSLVRLQLDEP